ncbi:hypothetical protein FRC07_011186 [Ceratobasidium sp. 392]|nr:hypothetical protein FRC07_011186 [Ceratobasidium sp. 392]
MPLLSLIRRGWKALKKGCRDVFTTIEDSFVSLKNDLSNRWNDTMDWISKPANRNRLIVKSIKHAVFTVVFCGALYLIFGPIWGSIAGLWVAAWKSAEYMGFSPSKEWFGNWEWLVRLLMFGATGLIWTAAEWVADGVSTGVQKIMKWFGAEF